ncbi:MAG: hypothetical protein K2M36_02150 [Clostridia bacterium]|nr:hypothetical protein [Clostridia bacterium]
MLEWNVKFQEEYKRLDALCKDLFSSKEGISEYIREMENTPYEYRNLVSGWDLCYKQLKHMRWMRNQFAHEVGTLNSDLCTYDDILWIRALYTQILHVCDPLAIVGKAQRARTQQNVSPSQRKYQQANVEYNPPISLWKRIKLAIKKWFQ